MIFHLGHFHTFSNGLLKGKENLAYNFTQTIQCAPNSKYLDPINTPVYHFKKAYIRKLICLLCLLVYILLSTILVPTYNEAEETLEWSTEPILEVNKSSMCPSGFERKGPFCQGKQSYCRYFHKKCFFITSRMS